MSRPEPLPTELRSRPFRTNEARTAGLTRASLRGESWVRLLHDVYVHRNVRVDAGVRVQALRLVMPADGVACGLTAAWFHGAWQPRPGTLLPLEQARTRTGAPLSRAGTRGRRLILDGDVVEIGGVAVTSPHRTCFDLMRGQPLVEMVVIADAFAWRGALSLPRLDAYVQTRNRWPGVRRVRIALQLASRLARSPGESRLRMVVVLSGFPAPLVNVPIYSDRRYMCLRGAGRVLGVPDLLMLGKLPVGLEYDGRYHFEGTQHAADIRRENALTALAGIPLLRYDARSLTYDRSAMVTEIEQLSGLFATSPLDLQDFWLPGSPVRF